MASISVTSPDTNPSDTWNTSLDVFHVVSLASGGMEVAGMEPHAAAHR